VYTGYAGKEAVREELTGIHRDTDIGPPTNPTSFESPGPRFNGGLHVSGAAYDDLEPASLLDWATR